MTDNIEISVRVNGRTESRIVEPRMHLADFLRYELGLTGTHVGCEQGACGNCTVLLGGEAVKACLVLAVQADGCDVTTVEILADGKTLSPLQRAFKEGHALQCGFCTPGFLMIVTALEQSGARLTRSELREELSGVLCRCTGYEPIVEAAARHLRSEG